MAFAKEFKITRQNNGPLGGLFTVQAWMADQDGIMRYQASYGPLRDEQGLPIEGNIAAYPSSSWPHLTMGLLAKAARKAIIDQDYVPHEPKGDEKKDSERRSARMVFAASNLEDPATYDRLSDITL